MTTVMDLEPGDHITVAGTGATFIAHVRHPTHPGFRQVVWRMDDGTTSFDCLLPQQHVGDSEPMTDRDRVEAIRRAIGTPNT